MNIKEENCNLAIYQDSDHQLSRDEVLTLIESESRAKYAHLSPKFYPDHWMQAKISINDAGSSLLHNTPKKYIDILRSEKFTPESFAHFNENSPNEKDGQQYVLENLELKSIGVTFVMKATFGPNFISVWFRNDSTNPRMDLPIFYGLEILNRIHHKIDALHNHSVINTKQHTDNININIA